MKIFYKLLPVVFLPPLLLAVGLFLCVKKPAFGPGHISSALSPKPEWETPPPDETIKTLLAQPFSFLGSGSQCYAFLSQDGKTVLKFFRMKNFAPKPWYFLLPPIGTLKTMREEKIGKQRERLYKLFSAYKLAYDELKEEAGLIFLHLNKTEEALPCTIFDKAGKQHTLNLAQLEFVVQKRADVLLKDQLFNLVQRGERRALEEMKKMLFAHILKRQKKGIIDRDQGLENNYGFSGGALFLLDPGRLERLYAPEDWERIEERFSKMLTNCSRQEDGCPK